MPGWTSDEVKAIGGAEEIEILSLLADETFGSPRTIWVVSVGPDLFVRSVRGRSSAWFKATQLKCAGRIEAGGLRKDVSFLDEPAMDINERIDAAYRDKYRKYKGAILNSVLTPKARGATLRLSPR